MLFKIIMGYLKIKIIPNDHITLMSRQIEPIQQKIERRVSLKATKPNIVKNIEKNNTIPRSNFNCAKFSKNSSCIAFSSTNINTIQIITCY